jgi:hypothetical protein
MQLAFAPSSLITDAEAQVAVLASRVVALAETIGVLASSSISGITRGELDAALDSFAGLGVAKTLTIQAKHASVEDLAGLLPKVLEAIGQSPLPAQEWPALTSLLGEDLLAGLVATSPSSINRYRAGARATPDPIASRLHTVALITADLSGSYNAFGVRRWFTRPRSALDGAAPADLLSGDWEPDTEPVERVRALAAALLG